MVGPTGVDTAREARVPTAEQKRDMTAEQNVTFLKVLKTLIADSAGNIIKAETNSAPTSSIATTVIIPTVIADRVSYTPTCVPVAAAKLESKVTAKILL